MPSLVELAQQFKLPADELLECYHLDKVYEEIGEEFQRSGGEDTEAGPLFVGLPSITVIDLLGAQYFDKILTTLAQNALALGINELTETDETGKAKLTAKGMTDAFRLLNNLSFRMGYAYGRYNAEKEENGKTE